MNLNWNLKSEKLLKNLTKNNFLKSNISQKEIFATFNEQKNNIVVSPTGTGKTIGTVIYLINLLSEKPDLKVMFFLPTKELIDQVFKYFNTLGKECDFLNVKALTKNFNLNSLNKANVLIGTPDHFSKLENKLVFKNHKLVLVLDEVDTLIEMGFSEKIQSFLKINNSHFYKKMALSAFIPKGLMTQLKIWFKTYNQKIIQNRTDTQLQHSFLLTRKEKKLEDLVAILNYTNIQKQSGTLVFVNSKKEAEELYKNLKSVSDLNLVLFHSDLKSKERISEMNFIRNSENIIIITTDLLARGISLKQINYVINYSLPKSNIWYIHRSGRTGRFNQPGDVINLVVEQDLNNLNVISKNNVNFTELKIRNNQLVAKKARKKVKNISEEAVKAIKKIKAEAPKKVKPNYKKNLKAKIKKVLQKDKRDKIEKQIKTKLLNKWKNESKKKTRIANKQSSKSSKKRK